MDRPGLKQLLAEVEADRVDVIVLYKVDRLTRSLADFARIVEVLDGAGASFVSVTQSFNTTTSMGRLTLNVLLSFAQFEREVTGERIRDKVAASKAKGMWMGGVVPLGYQVVARKLLVEENEAATVRLIFGLYAELGSTNQVVDELRRRGVVTKARTLSDERKFGGMEFTRGSLAHLFKSRVYIGEVSHRDQVYAGEHEGIVERELWKRVQALLAGNSRERRVSARGTQPSLLAGMLRDGHGRPMTPTHATKGTRRYRYYVTRERETDDPHRTWRLPAHAIEQVVVERLSQYLGDGSALIDRLLNLSAETLELIQQRSATLAEGVLAKPFASRVILLELGLKVQVNDDCLDLTVDQASLLRRVLGNDHNCTRFADGAREPLTFNVPIEIRRRAQELRLVYRPTGGAAPAQVDQTLVGLIVRAHQARYRLLDGANEVSAVERPHVTRLARLSYLAPDIVTAIIDGRQPPELTARQLMRTAHLPMCWQRQGVELGFA